VFGPADAREDFGLPDQDGGNIMNNRAGHAEAKHYNRIRVKAEEMFGGEVQCKVVPNK
jgi:hypothetical protein